MNKTLVQAIEFGRTIVILALMVAVIAAILCVISVLFESMALAICGILAVIFVAGIVVGAVIGFIGKKVLKIEE